MSKKRIRRYEQIKGDDDGPALTVYFRIIEHKTRIKAHDEKDRSQFRGIEELIFRYELNVLLAERTAQLSTYPLAVTHDQKAVRERGYISLEEMGFVKQNTDYISQQIQKRLASNKNLHVDIEQIKEYLKNVSRVFRSNEAQGNELEAKPYLNWDAKETQEEAHYDANKDLAGRILNPPKQGRVRPVMLYGKVYPSIRAAADANPKLSYDYIRITSLRALDKIMKT